MKCSDMIQMRQLVQWVERHGFHTGSQVIGGATDASDYDYVVHKSELMSIGERLGLDTKMIKDIEAYGLKFMSLKYTVDGKCYNIIVCDSSYECSLWMLTTRICTQMASHLFDKKKHRVAIFEAIMEALRGE